MSAIGIQLRAGRLKATLGMYVCLYLRPYYLRVVEVAVSDPIFCIVLGVCTCAPWKCGNGQNKRV